VQYDRPTIAEACGAYLGGRVVVMATVTGATCGGYPAATPEGYPVTTQEGYPTATEEGYPAATEDGYPGTTPVSYDDYTGGQGVPAFDKPWYNQEPYINYRGGGGLMCGV
jgi:hypothetical protein